MQGSNRNMFTCDPILHYLPVRELARLRALNKDIKQAVDAHLATKQWFTLGMPYFWLEMKALDHLPKLTDLSVCFPPWSSEDDIAKCLKPTLKTFTVFLANEFEMSEGHLIVNPSQIRHYIKVLKTLQKKLAANELLDLDSFNIVLYNDVEIIESYTTHEVYDYDEYGPMYETDYVEVRCSKYDPIHYWMLSDYNETDLVELETAYREALLANPKRWKKITYPYNFFGSSAIADLFPQTIFTNWLTETSNTIEKHVFDSLEAAFKAYPCCSYCARHHLGQYYPEPEAGAPDADTPEAGAPDADTPEAGAPEAHAPEPFPAAAAIPAV